MTFTPRFARYVAYSLCIAAGLSVLSFHPLALAAGSGGKGGSSASSHTKQAAPGRQYDSQGRYTGRVDGDGRRYDSQGRFVGRIDPKDGRQYDSQGRNLGRIEANGRQYDSQGKYLGRVEGNGRLYDDNGRFTGRIDADGRQYDAQGRYTGRLESAAANQTAIAISGPAVKQNQPSQLSEANRTPQANQQALTVVGNRAVAPFVFCNYGDKDCGN
jgi:YD repeat-containing protein